MQKVLITGASDGIGKAIAYELDKKGYTLYLFGRSSDKLEKILADLNNVKKAFAFDMQNRSDLYKALEEIDRSGGVDILINNAGAVLERSSVPNINIDLFDKMMNLNCTTHLICIEKTIDKMIENKYGHIINILSSCCKYNVLNMGAYTASKKAMEALNHTLAKEVKDLGIKVCAVYPGGVDTNFRSIDRPDYLRPDTIAKQISFILENDDGIIQEIITRPIIENNY